MTLLAPLPGRPLEHIGNGVPRGMVAHDRTRLIGELPLSSVLYKNRPCRLIKKQIDYSLAGVEVRHNSVNILSNNRSTTQLFQTNSIMLSILRDLFIFLLARKKYWLLPIVLMLSLIGGIIVLGKGSAIAPFIYTIF